MDHPRPVPMRLRSAQSVDSPRSSGDRAASCQAQDESSKERWTDCQIGSGHDGKTYTPLTRSSNHQANIEQTFRKRQAKYEACIIPRLHDQTGSTSCYMLAGPASSMFAQRLLNFCSKFARCLLDVCLTFARRLLDVCSMFAQCLLDDCFV